MTNEEKLLSMYLQQKRQIHNLQKEIKDLNNEIDDVRAGYTGFAFAILSMVILFLVYR